MRGGAFLGAVLVPAVVDDATPTITGAYNAS